MRTGLIIGVLAALATTSARAESWGLIRNDKDEALAVDLGTRKHEGDSASQWIIAMYPTPQAFGNVRADYISDPRGISVRRKSAPKRGDQVLRQRWDSPSRQVDET